VLNSAPRLVLARARGGGSLADGGGERVDGFARRGFVCRL